MASKAQPRNPLAVVVVERGGSVEEVAVSQPYGPERVIVIDGQRFEHSATDADGVWRYRAEAF